MDEITIKILEERFQIGIEMTKKIMATNKLKLTDFEVADLGLRVGQSLFIEKNKSYRMSQIPRKE